MKTGIFLVRHGQTAWNKEEVFRGSIDVPLNQHGLSEALAVGTALKSQNISFIYSSPLSRAVATATPLAEIKNLKVIAHNGFVDMNFGKWEGRKLEDIEKEEPELFSTWKEKPENCKIPGGETLGEVQRRALDAFWEIARNHAGQTGMIVSHRVICKLIILGLLNLGPEMFWNLHQDTAAINYFIMDGNRSIVYRINDTCHLAALKEGAVTADF